MKSTYTKHSPKQSIFVNPSEEEWLDNVVSIILKGKTRRGFTFDTKLLLLRPLCHLKSAHTPVIFRCMQQPE